MKLVLVSLRILGVALAIIAFGAFASNLIPVEGLDLGSWRSSNGDHHFFKVVPTSDNSNPILYGVLFTLLSFVCFVVTTGLKRSAKW